MGEVGDWGSSRGASPKPGNAERRGGAKEGLEVPGNAERREGLALPRGGAKLDREPDARGRDGCCTAIVCLATAMERRAPWIPERPRAGLVCATATVVFLFLLLRLAAREASFEACAASVATDAPWLKP